jgi:hypothetical protein
MNIQFDILANQVIVSLTKGEKTFPIADLQAFLIDNYPQLVHAHFVGTVETKEGTKWTFDWGNIYTKCVTLWLPIEDFLHTQNPLWMGKPAPKQSELF